MKEISEQDLLDMGIERVDISDEDLQSLAKQICDKYEDIISQSLLLVSKEDV